MAGERQRLKLLIQCLNSLLDYQDAGAPADKMMKLCNKYGVDYNNVMLFLKDGYRVYLSDSVKTDDWRITFVKAVWGVTNFSRLDLFDVAWQEMSSYCPYFDILDILYRQGGSVRNVIEYYASKGKDVDGYYVNIHRNKALEFLNKSVFYLRIAGITLNSGIPIEYLSMQTATTNALKSAGIKTFGRLCAFTPATLQTVRGIDTVRLGEIQSALSRLGLSLS